MGYADFLAQVKAAGFEELAWVAAVSVPLVGMSVWFFKRKHPASMPAGNLNSAADQSKIGQQIGGTGNVVIQNNSDPAQGQITLHLLKAIAQKDQQLAEKDARILELSVSQIQDRSAAVDTVVDEAAKLQPTALAVQAKQELLLGNVDAAVRLLLGLSDAAKSDAQPHLEDAAKYAREAGALLAGRDTLQAIAAYERALLIEADDLELLDALIPLYSNVGNSSQARELANRLLGLTKVRAGADKANTEWQRDLSVSYDKIGDLQNAEGKRADALASYQAGLTIRKRLAELDKANTQWQRDLSVSYDRIGDLQKAEGKRADALASYQAGLTIAKRLAALDKANTEWQTDLVVSFWKLGKLASPKEAAVLLRDALNILKRLDAAGALHADQKDWQAMMQERLDGLT